MQPSLLAFLLLGVLVFETEARSPMCQSNRACTRHLEYVCGSDSITYSNPCVLLAAKDCDPSIEQVSDTCCDNEEGRKKCSPLRL
ncbi:hypothetical protein V1264_022032 [Littorina saxatilis]|uniref:Kazal-like domain-containing protein n=1 Tax=Littorina saxatilis TaxID=31220 RepID=A0AAN9AJM0_9CAEN